MSRDNAGCMDKTTASVININTAEVGVQTNEEYIPEQEFQQVVENLQDEISVLRSMLREMRSTSNIELDDLRTLVMSNSSALCKPVPSSTRPMHNVRKPTTPTPDTQIKPRYKSPATVKQPMPKTRSKLSVTSSSDPKSQLDRSKEKAVALVSDDAGKVDLVCSRINFVPSYQNTKDISVKFDPCSSPRPSESTSSNANIGMSNNDWPQLTDLKPGTETLILGDSVIAGLHGNKMSVAMEATLFLG